ncbi:hypothetical protein ACHWQZ_G003884 [Mnemiopsis leidyi]
MSFYVSNHDSLYKCDSNWSFITQKVHQLFKDKKLKELQLSKISKCLMELVGHENDITLSLEYKNTLMKGGMKFLLENLNDEKKRLGENFDLLYNLGELWSEFMREIIPTLQLIFANIKHLNAKGDSVERITLEQFRDDVVLCTDIENVIQNIVKQSDSVYEIPRSVVQMLLVLGNLANSDKTSDNQRRICNLCSLVVKPYINPFDTKTQQY